MSRAHVPGIALAAALVLVAATLAAGCEKAGSAMKSNLTCGSPAAEIVERNLGEIRSLVPKRSEPPGDPHADAILSLGAAAIPCLIAKIDDATASPVFHGCPFAIGDVAADLLDRTCRLASWPFPDGSHEPTPGPDGCWAYVDLVRSPGGRHAVRTSWESYYAAGGCTLARSARR